MVFLPVWLLGQTFPSTPINTNVGNLHCGLRLVSVGRVQTWCYEGSGTSNLPHNTISTISNGRVVVDGYSSGTDQILWIISQVGPQGEQIRYSVSTSSLTNPTTLNNGVLAMQTDGMGGIYIARSNIMKYQLTTDFPFSDIWESMNGTIDYLQSQ